MGSHYLSEHAEAALAEVQNKVMHASGLEMNISQTILYLHRHWNKKLVYPTDTTMGKYLNGWADRANKLEANEDNP